MKVDVWVTIGKPGESIFLETRSINVNVPTDGRFSPTAVVFELPLGARLDGRGPIRVMLEPRQLPGLASNTNEVPDLPVVRRGALWGSDLITALQLRGLVPHKTKRIIIDCPHDGFATIHIEGALDNEKSVEVLESLVVGAMVVEREPGVPAPPSSPREIDPDEIPF